MTPSHWSHIITVKSIQLNSIELRLDRPTIGLILSILLTETQLLRKDVQLLQYCLVSRGCNNLSFLCNKANLRDLIAATGLVILLNLHSNRQFFSPCDLEIWWMTPKNNKAPLQCYFKLFASFRSHCWIQTGVQVRKCLIWVKIVYFFSRVTLKFDGWPLKTTGHPFYATSSFVQHFVAIGEFKLDLQSGNP